MLVKRLDNGNLLVPARAESDDGDVLGDGTAEIGPDDPDYEAWARELERQQARPGSSSGRPAG